MRTTFAKLGALTLGALLVTGCAATASPAATPTPTELGKVGTIEEVRDAFIDAGGVCNWEQDDKVSAATASGTCSDQTVIMLFADPDDLQTVMENLRSIPHELTLLVGENWIINSSEAEAMQDELGGEWVTE